MSWWIDGDEDYNVDVDVEVAVDFDLVDNPASTEYVRIVMDL